PGPAKGVAQREPVGQLEFAEHGEVAWALHGVAGIRGAGIEDIVQAMDACIALTIAFPTGDGTTHLRTTKTSSLVGWIQTGLRISRKHSPVASVPAAQELVAVSVVFLGSALVVRSKQ